MGAAGHCIRPEETRRSGALLVLTRISQDLSRNTEEKPPVSPSAFPPVLARFPPQLTSLSRTATSDRRERPPSPPGLRRPDQRGEEHLLLPEQPPGEQGTPTPATMQLMKATMLAVVVMKPTKAPNWSAGEAGFSGHWPDSVENISSASGARVR